MNARRLAFEILSEVGSGRHFAAELLDARLAENPLDDRDRRLLTEITLGVLRRRFALEAMVRPFVRRPPEEIDADVRILLEIGAYQIAYLDGVPARAAVSESVELAKAVNPRASGFVNGVLRRVGELVTERTVDAPAGNALPLRDGRFRLLNRAVFPHPKRQPGRYLSEAFTWPEWLTGRWLERFGFDECVRIGFWSVANPSVWLRPNRLRVEPSALAEKLREAAIETEAAGDSLRLLIRKPIRELPGYDAGEFSVQDPTATAAADAVGAAEGMAVLDLCAAPGGKTTRLAELMGNRGRIIACDTDPDRLRTVSDLSDRLGITILEPCVIRADGGDIPDGPFDAALVDVPCSNTGVIARRPEVRHRLRPRDLRELTVIQSRLLNQAIDRVRPGGVVVYSTCSLEPEENGELVELVRLQRMDVTVEAEHESVPGEPSDGGYWAKLRRVGE